MNIFASNDNPTFYTADGQVAIGVDLPQQYRPFFFSTIGKFHFIGKTTGQIQLPHKGRSLRREVEIAYFHWWLIEQGMPPKIVALTVRLWVEDKDILHASQVPWKYRNPLARTLVKFAWSGYNLWQKFQ